MSTHMQSYVITKKSWKLFGRISIVWNAIQGKRLVYLVAILSLAIEVLFTFTSPFIVKITIDSIIGKEPLSIPLFLNQGIIEWLPTREWFLTRLWVPALAFVGCILFQSLFSFIAGYSANVCAEHAAKRLRDRLYAHIQNLPYETLLRSQSGDWFQRCTSDVDTVRRFICSESMEIFRTLFLVSVAFPVMYSLSPRLTFWGILVVPLIILYSCGFHVIVERVFIKADEKEGVLSGIIQENVHGVRVVRAFAREIFETRRFSIANDGYRDQVFKLIAWLGLFWGFSSFLGLLQIAIVVSAGLMLMKEGLISLGMIVLFLTYEHQTLWPIRQFGRVLADTGKTKVALGRIAELFILPEEKDLDFVEGEDTILPTNVPVDMSIKEERREQVERWTVGSVEFDHVSFVYPDGTSVLDNISFRMDAGETLAIVGPTGSGKSTLVHLLLRLYEPTQGRILLGGRDIRTFPKRELREKISLVLQEGFLFGKTIRENIRMGRIDANDELLITSARNAALHQVITEFPAGYDTMVGERGVTLSGGQRQRLTLARALVRGSALLILDDSMSAVDTETDRMIRDGLDREKDAVRGTIIIAHRLTTLASADRILVLEKGRITALGTHSELVATPGLYRRLAELQRAVEEETR